MPRDAVERGSNGHLSDRGQDIVEEELSILQNVRERLQREAEADPQKIEDLDAQLLELRDAIAEAKEEDVPSLIDQMHQVAALSRKRGQGRSIPIDPNNPYFGHLRLREARSGRSRDVLIGRHTLLDDGNGVSIVDWRNAPVSRLYYRYEEEDDYDEEFDDRNIEGQILVRRSLAVTEGELRRVAAPQGTYARDREGMWRETVGSARPTLQGGAGAAIRVPKDQLGVHGDDEQLRADKRLQEITALIDREQFELITRPESGIVLIQGGAGSGKTTVALHRVAYLAFQDHKRFQPSKMLIVVFNDALVEYIRHVLPSLGVEGVVVTTYRRWSTQLLQRTKLKLDLKHMLSTPDAVVRFKKHPVVLRMIDDIVQEQVEEVLANLQERVASRPGGNEVVDTWKRYNSAGLHRCGRSGCSSGSATAPAAGSPPRPRPRPRRSFATRRRPSRTSSPTGWSSTPMAGGSRPAIREHGGDAFSDADIGTIVRWCAKKAELDGDAEKDDTTADPVGLDAEDDAILLRLMQAKDGGVFVNNRRFEYEHVVIDEAQDLCPLEVRVLLDSVSKGHSVTIAGDKAQKMIFDNGFTDWPQLLDDAGLPHTEIQPLEDHLPLHPPGDGVLAATSWASCTTLPISSSRGTGPTSLTSSSPTPVRRSPSSAMRCAV